MFLGFFSNAISASESSGGVELVVGVVDGYLEVPVNVTFETMAGTAQGIFPTIVHDLLAAINTAVVQINWLWWWGKCSCKIC